MSNECNTPGSPDRQEDRPRLCIVGPSHVVRWEHLLAIGSLPPPGCEVSFVHSTGAPLWDREVFEATADVAARTDSRIVLIIGDFRFGNSIVRDNLQPRYGDLFSGYSHITSELIGARSDLEVRLRAEYALLLWRKTYGERLRMVYWTQAMRSVVDGLAGKHLNPQGVSTHPLWPLDRYARTGDPIVPDLSAVLQRRPERYAKLIVDNDLHPSAIGYSLLEKLGLDMPFAEAIERAERESQGRLMACLAEAAREPIMIIGEGGSLAPFTAHFSAADLQLLERAQILLRPELSMSCFEDALRVGIRKVTVVTNRGPHQPDPAAKGLKELGETLALLAPFEISILPLQAIDSALGTTPKKRMDLQAEGVGEVADWLEQQARLTCRLAVRAEVFSDSELPHWFQPHPKSQLTPLGAYGILLCLLQGQDLQPARVNSRARAIIRGY
ncbi:hypothetical protein [Oryzibacter oryziterrae]|uniref:hypothetical protein n=1 Tax=Oryzibacter oryziterrae TaxID=2766474 RepID=UPI001F1F8613|nr:hypothetical protein [Oryzibacter oryziterrae]